jgi:hypothetical protein
MPGVDPSQRASYDQGEDEADKLIIITRILLAATPVELDRLLP